MKISNQIAGIILIGMLAGCSAANKTDQTVDDVYYSPGRAIGVDQGKNDVTNDEYAYNKEEDNYLRMKVQNPNRWSSIDDYAYWNSYNTTYYGLNTFGYSSIYNNYWNNYYYNPYLSIGFYSNYYGYDPYAYYSYNNGYNYYNPGVYYKTVRSNSGPKTNLGAYQNHTFNNQNYSNSNAGHSNYVNGNTQPQTGVGRLLRTIVSGGNQNYNTTPSYNPARTFSSPSTNTSTQSSSSSSSGNSRTTGSSASGARGGRGN